MKAKHCHHQNDFCTKVGSDENHFNVLLIVRDKVTRQCPQTTTLEEKGEPKQFRAQVLLLTSLTFLPLGQIGSQSLTPSNITHSCGPFVPDTGARGECRQSVSVQTVIIMSRSEDEEKGRERGLRRGSE